VPGLVRVAGEVRKWQVEARMRVFQQVTSGTPIGLPSRSPTSSDCMLGPIPHPRGDREYLTEMVTNLAAGTTE
jgi:hypothetical protein